MNLKMFSSMWLFALTTFFLVDTRTAALPLKETGPHRCFECNGTACEDTEEFADDETGKPVVVCPRERPYCSTRARAPKFISALSCDAAADTPCTLNNPNKDTFEIICVCSTHLCNAPFSPDMRAEMFYLKNSSQNRSELVRSFRLKSDHAGNSSVKHDTQFMISYATDTPLNYTAVLSILNAVFLNSTLGHYDDYNGPRFGFLKHHTTLPSDDEEDDGEGSGTLDMKPNFESPAYSTSVTNDYTLEDEIKTNNAQLLFLNILSAIPLFMYLII